MGEDGEKKGERQAATADLDRVTDYVEDRELDADRFASVQKSMDAMFGSSAAAAASRKSKGSKAQEGKELHALKVAPEHIKLVMEHLELDEPAAELALKRHGGDVRATLHSLLSM
ncbi:Huntingtin-interacting protein K [Porphyridium purpureum]|uniref:Huntingtin-interacting protein K n=1 Tax=Porphyridium purpureum TaxID=35688 RepID=A0A5J4Z775_PORPP|nr:Huntingtin-interacting protein K [Porphyridium purpureum]KAA8499010.1 Huntingtin-interacting protein K [Porphyridium purpureum]|eukprot:POR0478..scf295_1